MDGDDVGLPRNGFGVGVREVHAAPSGLGVFIGPFTQGVALGYHIVPRWGGKPVPPSGWKIGASLGRKAGAPFGVEDWCVVGAEDRCVEVICFQPQRGERRKPRATPWVRIRIRYASPEGAV
jgi:hypothetical protein